jgi:hypothetical protein
MPLFLTFIIFNIHMCAERKLIPFKWWRCVMMNVIVAVFEIKIHYIYIYITQSYIHSSFIIRRGQSSYILIGSSLSKRRTSMVRRAENRTWTCLLASRRTSNGATLLYQMSYAVPMSYAAQIVPLLPSAISRSIAESDQ